MEKAALRGLFKFLCPGDMQAVVTPEPTKLYYPQEFSLTVSLTATFAPLLGVGFGFPRLLVISFK